MEKRVYFIIGDLITAAGTGAVTGVVCVLIVGNGWSPLAAMALGMVLGMALAFLLSALLGILFGAFEVMIPAMTTGMLVGMVVTMQVTGEIPLSAVAQLGAELGIGVMTFTYLMNALMIGEVKKWTS